MCRAANPRERERFDGKRALERTVLVSFSARAETWRVVGWGVESWPVGGGLRLALDILTIGLGALGTGLDMSETSSAALSRGSARFTGTLPTWSLWPALTFSCPSFSFDFSTTMFSLCFFSNSLIAFLSNSFLQLGHDSFILIQSSRHSE